MLDFEKARRNMVDCQLRTCEVTSLPVLAAFEAVPRERFVPSALQDQAYLDRTLSLGTRAMLPPMLLGRLIQIGQVTRADKVLDVGCGLGYSTAVLAHLSGSVVGLESDSALASSAESNLRALGLANASVVQGSLDRLPSSAGPFDLVLINGAFEEVPAAFLAAMVEGGRLIGVSTAQGSGRAVVLTKTDGTWSERAYYSANAPLIAEYRKAPAFAF